MRCAFLLLIFALFFVGLLLLVAMAVGGGSLAGAGIGAAVGATRPGPRSPRPGSMRTAATLGGCVGALVGLLLAAIGLTIAFSQ